MIFSEYQETTNESFFSHAQNKIQNHKNLKLPQSKIVHYNYLVAIYNYDVYHCSCSHSDISGLNFFSFFTNQRTNRAQKNRKKTRQARDYVFFISFLFVY